MAGRLDPAVARARARVRVALADLEPGAVVLVGLSGGADSLALAVATSFVAPREGWAWGAVVVDHGLQPGSRAAARAAADQAGTLGADPVVVVAARVDHCSGAGPEGAARAARHAALLAVASDTGAAAVLLGHTRDDQAESVLLGLARGSGARSLAGMRPRAGLLRRPFLDLTRAETEAVCAAHGLRAWTDPHNTDPAHARVRTRTEVLPVLERELGPGVSAALARTAGLLRDDADLLDALAADLLARVRHSPRAESDVSTVDPVLDRSKRHSQRDGEAGGVVQLDVRGLAEAPAALRRRALRSAALEAGAPATDLTADHVAAVEQLVVRWHGQRGVDLPGPVHAVRRGGDLRVASGRVKA